jgi:hypothetical protein
MLQLNLTKLDVALKALYLTIWEDESDPSLCINKCLQINYNHKLILKL